MKQDKDQTQDQDTMQETKPEIQDKISLDPETGLRIKTEQQIDNKIGNQGAEIGGNETKARDPHQDQENLIRPGQNSVKISMINMSKTS